MEKFRIDLPELNMPTVKSTERESNAVFSCNLSIGGNRFAVEGLGHGQRVVFGLGDVIEALGKKRHRRSAFFSSLWKIFFDLKKRLGLFACK